MEKEEKKVVGGGVFQMQSVARVEIHWGRGGMGAVGPPLVGILVALLLCMFPCSQTGPSPSICTPAALA